MTRLLLVEPSATMRYVLENYAQSLGFGVESIAEYSQAEDALQQQYRVYGNDFAGVLLGWPTVADANADTLIGLLDSADFADLPVLVMSTDMRAETRAWVAGREHTAVLAWKEYQAADELLARLLDESSGQTETFPTKFDNHDIHVLIVDDSVSIQFSLRDLFELQGYRITLAGSHNEALAAARQTSFDIAVLDFYLQDGTGDALCRELINDPDTGDLTCTILTGTYADHIIKRSLRAGAVECMFKNESSELLLARIDAISRFVRQRKQLKSETQRLDGALDSVAGATVIINTEDIIIYANQSAATCLGFENPKALEGSPARFIIVDLPQLRGQSAGKYRNRWQDAEQRVVNVVYRRALLANSSDIVVNFKAVPAAVVSQTQLHIPQTPMAIIEALQLPSSSSAFIACLDQYLSNDGNKTDTVSLLVIDVSASQSGQKAIEAQQIDGMTDQLQTALTALYKRENHVAYLGGSCFGFLLRHSSDSHVYLLTRKIMQSCNELSNAVDLLTISCAGCLISLSKNNALPTYRVIIRVKQGLAIASKRGPNQALLLDIRRMLPVYSRTSDKAEIPAGE